MAWHGDLTLEDVGLIIAQYMQKRCMNNCAKKRSVCAAVFLDICEKPERSVSKTPFTVLPFWTRASNPIQASHLARDKINTLHDEWLFLKKSKSKSGPAHVAREQTFAMSLCRLFVIAYLTLLTDEDDQIFMLA